MIENLSKISKLRGRSLDEIRVRCAQSLAAYAERRGWSAQTCLPSDPFLFKMMSGAHGESVTLSRQQGLLDHFRTRTSPSFFAAFADREWTLAELRRRFGRRIEELIIKRADHIREGRLDLLGFHDLYFGHAIDWHLEPISGKRAPLLHWSQINYLDANVTGDKKIIWELNRHQYFMTLGQAYWYTRDELYARAFIAHISAWMNENPPKIGINWASSLEVAFRAISWLWALHFFKDSPQLTPAVFLQTLKFLYLHGRHLETYLSTYFSPNTHLTGEALGLFYLGTLLPEFRCAKRWRATGHRILLAELDRHVKPDGVYFEQSSYYHRYTTDFYTHLYILAEANSIPIESDLKERLVALLDHLMYITRPDGTTPFFGDDDGGKLLVLDERARNDFRATLSTGAALFNRPDLKYVAGEVAEETLWLLGRRGIEAFDQLNATPPPHDSRAFTEGGYYVMRDGWGPDANYLLIDCGPHGTLNCGHAHADALSFDLAVRGRTLVVDPGTYTYTGSTEMRDLFRTSAAHNTLTIDGESSSVPDGPFTWKHVARSSMRKWISHKRFDLFEGEHDGYRRLTEPALHARSIMFLKGSYWIMRDRIATTGKHHYDLHFHFVPEADPLIEVSNDVSAVHVHKQDARLGIFAFGSGGEWRRENGWVSACYGARARAPVCSFSVTAEGAQEFVTFFIQRSAQAPKAGACEIEAVGGRAFEVCLDDASDILLVGDGRLVETARIATDCQWAWVRFGRDGDPLELVLIGGRLLRIDGQDVISATERVGYVAGHRIGNELQVETDAKNKPMVVSLGASQALNKGLVEALQSGHDSPNESAMTEAR